MIIHECSSIGQDLWGLHARGHWCAITTNGVTKADGTAVMGRGVARQAALRYPNLPLMLGRALQGYGNHLYPVPQFRLVCFPTKHHWADRASLPLIEQSARELVEWLDSPQGNHVKQVYMPRPGCGLGGLRWQDVAPVLSPILDDRVVIVQ